MEYIPNMVELHWSNYTPERMQSLVDTMEQMHAAKVLHNDIHPRNMMILEDDPKRAIWIDFDRAQTYGETLTELEESWFATEKAIVYEMARFMVRSLQL